MTGVVIAAVIAAIIAVMAICASVFSSFPGMAACIVALTVHYHVWQWWEARAR